MSGINTLFVHLIYNSSALSSFIEWERYSLWYGKRHDKLMVCEVRAYVYLEPTFTFLYRLGPVSEIHLRPDLRYF